MADMELDELIARVMRREANEEERVQLQDALSALDDEQLEVALNKAMDVFFPLQSPFSEIESRAILQEVLNGVNESKVHQAVIRPLWKRLSIAATILAIIGTGIYFLINTNKSQPQLLTAEQIIPTHKGVSLKLSNGEVIELASVTKGLKKTSDGIALNEQNSSVAYNTTSDKAVWHTLTNNSANKYEVMLNDGTNVYLDVASSITFPTKFEGDERKVIVSGQAYFNVHHNAAKPFRVEAGSELVEDIGTAFNIYAYGDDPVIKTTLIEGAVKVNHAKGSRSVLLKPGELAVLENGQIKTLIADTEAETAWLQGKMIMHRESLESILTKVSRIYDVQIVWMDNDLKNIQCGGALSRTKSLANILDFIKRIGPVDFKVEGKIVKVFKNKR